MASKLPCVPLLSVSALIRGNRSEFHIWGKGPMLNNALAMLEWGVGGLGKPESPPQPLLDPLACVLMRS